MTDRIALARGKLSVALQNGPQRAINRAMEDLRLALTNASDSERAADEAITIAQQRVGKEYYARKSIFRKE